MCLWYFDFPSSTLERFVFNKSSNNCIHSADYEWLRYDSKYVVLILLGPTGGQVLSPYRVAPVASDGMASTTFR